MSYLSRNFMINEIKRMKPSAELVYIKGGATTLDKAPNKNIYAYYCRLKSAENKEKESHEVLQRQEN